MRLDRLGAMRTAIVALGALLVVAGLARAGAGAPVQGVAAIGVGAILVALGRRRPPPRESCCD